MGSFLLVLYAIVLEITENRRFRLSHCCLTLPLQGIHANISKKLYRAKLEIRVTVFAADSVDLSSFTVSSWAPKSSDVVPQGEKHLIVK